MAIEKGEAFARRDIYIDYDFEDVTYRWDHRQGTIHVRFYGEAESPSRLSTTTACSTMRCVSAGKSPARSTRRAFPRAEAAQPCPP